jgi:hypothetical protein
MPFQENSEAKMDDQGDDEARDDATVEQEALSALRSIISDAKSPPTARVQAARALLRHTQQRTAKRQAMADSAALDDLLSPPLVRGLV